MQVGGRLFAVKPAGPLDGEQEYWWTVVVYLCILGCVSVQNIDCPSVMSLALALASTYDVVAHHWWGNWPTLAEKETLQGLVWSEQQPRNFPMARAPATTTADATVARKFSNSPNIITQHSL